MNFQILRSILFNEESHSKKRLELDYKNLIENPLNNCFAFPTGDNYYKWSGTIEGPIGTVYENGIFFITISFPKNYPFQYPKVQFQTRIYHCNINSDGIINNNWIKENWRATFTVRDILLWINRLLENCDTLHPMVEKINKQYIEDRDRFDSIARLWTERYAS